MRNHERESELGKRQIYRVNLSWERDTEPNTVCGKLVWCELCKEINRSHTHTHTPTEWCEL